MVGLPISCVTCLGLELAEIQSRKEDVSCLPTLRIEDIERRLEPVKTISVNSSKNDFLYIEAYGLAASKNLKLKH